LMYSRLDASPAFVRAATRAAATHAEATGTVPTGEMLRVLFQISPEQLWRSHMARRVRLGPAQTARLDGYLARYCKSYFLQDWFPLSPTLLEHAMMLIMRVAMIRFLLVAQPEIGPDIDAATTDKAAIDVFYSVARTYDHNSAVREALSMMLDKHGMLSVAHAAALLKL
jgi:hypothetical protein